MSEKNVGMTRKKDTDWCDEENNYNPIIVNNLVMAKQILQIINKHQSGEESRYFFKYSKFESNNE